MAEKLAAKSYARIPDIYALPNLIEVQLNSFNWFIEEGLRDSSMKCRRLRVSTAH